MHVSDLIHILVDLYNGIQTLANDKVFNINVLIGSMSHR